MKRIRKDQVAHYHELLKNGFDARHEGLVWIIKSLWMLGEDVNINMLPIFLDVKSIDYLFEVNRKESLSLVC
jgi:hypothetical protein